MIDEKKITEEDRVELKYELYYACEMFHKTIHDLAHKKFNYLPIESNSLFAILYENAVLNLMDSIYIADKNKLEELCNKIKEENKNDR